MFGYIISIRVKTLSNNTNLVASRERTHSRLANVAQNAFASALYLHTQSTEKVSPAVYSYFEKIVGRNVHATIPKGNMGYDQYTVPDFVAVEPNLLFSFRTRKHMSMASPAILSTFFEEQ